METILKNQCRKRLENAFRKLPEQDIRLVRFLYFDEMTVKKTAEICGCSRKTIQNRRRRILEKMKNLMSEISPWKDIMFMSATERNRCQEDRGIPEREAWGYAAKASWHKVHGLSLCSRKGATAPFPASGEDRSGQSPVIRQGKVLCGFLE